MPVVEYTIPNIPTSTSSPATDDYLELGGSTNGSRKILVHDVNALTSFVRPEFYGAVGDGVTDDTEAVATALAKVGYTTLLTYGKTYLIRIPNVDVTDPAVPIYYSFPLRSGLKIVGNGATLKLADNCSTDASPKYFNIIHAISGSVYSNVWIENVTFDLNGANNGIGTPAFTNNTAAVYVGYAGSSVDGFVFRNNRVLNTPGSSCVVIGNNVDTVNGKNVWIDGNYFYNVGIDATDHSSIFVQADDAWVQNNYLKRLAYPNNSSSISGIELHGSRIHCDNNNVLLFRTGVIIGTSVGYPINEVYVTNNVLYVERWGVWIDKYSDAQAMHKLFIVDNTVNMADTDHGDTDPKAGIRVKVSANLGDVYIRGNQLYSSGNTNRSKFAIWVACDTAGDVIGRVAIDQNKVYANWNYGVYAQNTVGRIDNISINNNEFDSVLANAQYPTPAAVFVSAAAGLVISAVAMNGNRFRNLGAAVLSAVVLGNATGAIGWFSASGNVWEDTNDSIITKDYITRSTGGDALSFAALPTYGSWLIGERLTSILTVPGTTGAGTPWLVAGWCRMTNGTAHVLNTDWCELRMPDGL